MSVNNKMEFEKLKKLRKKIPIPLKKAIELLEKNNGNIEACEKEFHKLTIDAICKITDCEKEKATRIYYKFNFNKEKAIHEINNEQSVLAIEHLIPAKNTIGFILWFEDEHGKEYKTEKRNDIFIPTKDFDFIKKEFTSNCSENFSSTSSNYFDKSDCKLIIEAIQKIKTDHPNQNKFLQDLQDWMEKSLKFAEVLVVYGNL